MAFHTIELYLFLQNNTVSFPTVLKGAAEHIHCIDFVTCVAALKAS